MLPLLKLFAFGMLAIVLPLLNSGCAADSPPSLPPAVVEPARIPPLPAQARQPKAPPECQPTCLDGWLRSADAMLKLPMSADSPALPASGPTTR